MKLMGAMSMPVAALTASPQSSTAHWVSYGGSEAIILAIALLVGPADLPMPATGCARRSRSSRQGHGRRVYDRDLADDALHRHRRDTRLWAAGEAGLSGFVAARARVGTFVDAPITFFVILYLTRRWGWKVAWPAASSAPPPRR